MYCISLVHSMLSFLFIKTFKCLWCFVAIPPDDRALYQSEFFPQVGLDIHFSAVKSCGISSRLRPIRGIRVWTSGLLDPSLLAFCASFYEVISSLMLSTSGNLLFLFIAVVIRQSLLVRTIFKQVLSFWLVPDIVFFLVSFSTSSYFNPSISPFLPFFQIHISRVSILLPSFHLSVQVSAPYMPYSKHSSLLVSFFYLCTLATKQLCFHVKGSLSYSGPCFNLFWVYTP